MPVKAEPPSGMGAAMASANKVEKIRRGLNMMETRMVWKSERKDIYQRLQRPAKLERMRRSEAKERKGKCEANEDV